MSLKDEAKRISVMRRQWLVISLLSLFGISLLASLSTTVPFYLSARANLEQLTLVSTEAQAKSVEHLLESYRHIARQFTSRTEIRRRLEAYAQGALSLEEVQAFTAPRLMDAMSLSDEILGLIRLGPKDEVIAQLGEPLPLTALQPLLGATDLEVCRLVAPEQKPVILLTVPILGADGELIGRDVAWFATHALQAALTAPLSEQPYTEIYLINPPTETHLHIQAELSAPLQLVHRSSALESTQAGIWRSTESGQRRIYFQVPVVSEDWVLLLSKPTRHFYNPVLSQQLWSVSGVLLVILIGMLLLNAALRPWIQRLKKQAEDLQTSASELELAASVFEGTHEAIVITDPALSILKTNSAFEQVTGYPAPAVIGRLLTEFFEVGEPEASQRNRIWEPLLAKGSWQGEVAYERADGTPLPVLQTISLVRDESGEARNLIHIFNDISDNKAKEEQIERLAHYDQLTELPNRYYFERQLAVSVQQARIHHRELALMFMDLDHFKEVNDSLGHPVGDLLLRATAGRIQSILREEDLVARLGGDEFLVLLDQGVSREKAGLVANKILSALREPFSINGHQITIGVSIGIALFPEDAKTPDDLVKMADIAMYRAKDGGRNAYCYYDRKS